MCYANMQAKLNDDCNICNISVSKDAFSDSQERRCVERREREKKKSDEYRQDWIIRSSVSGAISLLVILATIIMFIKERRQMKNYRDNLSKVELSTTTANNNKNSKQLVEGLDGDNIGSFSSTTANKIEAYEFDENNNEQVNKNANNNNGVDQTDNSNDTKADSSEAHPNEQQPSSKLTELENQQQPSQEWKQHQFTSGRNRTTSSGSHFYRHQQQQQLRHRQRTFSETSTHSVGIGGGGPMLFGCYSRMAQLLPSELNDDNYHGIGGNSTSLFPTLSVISAASENRHRHHSPHHHQQHRQQKSRTQSAYSGVNGSVASPDGEVRRVEEEEEMRL
ncbi:hypothetical protein HELRODRAFT_189735 [Helobdella robusta]|uniref:Uncharacterized protein n=1 Tax=Helobdella robusta TaxID=6412 RepID=T1FRB4_HELRO|nr:hypothetical protein HELRODRAFT_189735 [Helobdella robusta]ESN91586.1 hypothetical protein HELRODRAFT_189735 [Helobdella robusta]